MHGPVCVLVLLAVVQTINGVPFDWGKRLNNRKIDCAVSAWTDWKCIGSSCDRSRDIVREPRNGGKGCGALVGSKNSNSKESPWKQTNVVAKVSKNFMVGHRRTLSLAQKDDGTPGGKTVQSRDLMFLVDMSGSITGKEFDTTKKKMAELIGLICGTIGKTRQHNRISVITFSHSVALNFDFKRYYNLKAVEKAIMRIPQQRGRTCTTKAFTFAHSYMFDPKSGVRDATESVKEVLVLTDGKSNCGGNLAREVKRLQVKAFVYALAIGKFSVKGKKEIESMVSKPLLDHIFSLKNFDRFFKMVDALKSYPANCAPFELSK